MRKENIELNIIINGKTITEYHHEGHTYVEGRSGSKFEIEISNNNGFDIEAIVSVDGLSITDGKEAGPASSGYLLKPFERIKIPGWKLGNTKAAAFEFSGKNNSYVALSTGSTTNNGVIGIMVFRSKKPAYNNDWYNHYMPVWYTSDYEPSPTICRGNGMNNIVSSWETSSSSNCSTQNIGTAFGETTSFETIATSFDRGDMVVMFSMYYDDARGLRRRGVPMDRKMKKSVSIPNAFPAMNGCVPPKGWKG